MTEVARVVNALRLVSSLVIISRSPSSRLTNLIVLKTPLKGVFVAIFIPPLDSIIT